MLLRLSLGREDAAAAIEGAVSTALDDDFRTADLVPPSGDDVGVRRVGTAAMTDAIIGRIAIPEAARATAAAPS
jgi:isocitrate/isopropylmalate dehydrogenase